MKLIVGDRVRVLSDPYGRAVGKLGTIIETDDADWAIVKMEEPFDGWGEDERCWGVPIEGLELASPAIETEVRIVQGMYGNVDIIEDCGHCVVLDFDFDSVTDGRPDGLRRTAATLNEIAGILESRTLP